MQLARMGCRACLVQFDGLWSRSPHGETGPPRIEYGNEIIWPGGSASQKTLGNGAL